MAKQISKPDKTSLVIDRKKVADAKKILGTRTLAETVDGALDEVIRLAPAGDSSTGSRRARRRHRPDAGRTPAASRAVGGSATSRTRARGIAAGDDADRWASSLGADGLAICAPIRLELLYSARGPRRATRACETTWRRCRELPLDDYAIALAERTQVTLAATQSASRAEADRPARRRESPRLRSDPAPLRPPLRRDRPRHGPADRVARPSRHPRLSARQPAFTAPLPFRLAAMKSRYQW